MTNSVSAIVVTYNSAAHIVACIRSLEAAHVADIVVVDNASQDTTVSLLQTLPVSCLCQAHNSGFAAANNQGFLHTRTHSEYILLLNPDAQLTANALPQALDYLVNNSQVGAVGLQLVTPQGGPEDFSWGEPVTLWSMFKRRKRFRDLLTPVQKCGWVSAGALLIRRSAWVEVQGFDPQFFMYWEDVDLCYRLRAQGWQVVHMATARVIHERGASLTDSRTKTHFYDQSADRYFRKHYATPIWLLQRLLRLLYRWWSPVVS